MSVSLSASSVCLSASCKSDWFYFLSSCIVITVESLISPVKEFLCIQPSFSALSKLSDYVGGGREAHEGGNICMHIADSHYYIAETNTTL